MTPHRSYRRIVRFHVTLVASLLAVLGLVAGLAPSASAQISPSTVLATQFFGSITGDGSSYFLSADAVLHAPGGDYVGRAGLEQFRTELQGSFSNLQFATHNAAQSGDLVIVSFTLTAINTGSYHGLAANCAGITVPGVARLRVRAETVSTASWIEGAMSQDLGLSEERQVNTVIEQWISYDATQITTQIAAVNLMDPDDRPGCAEPVLFQDAENAAAPVDEPALAPVQPPACTSKNLCELPY